MFLAGWRGNDVSMSLQTRILFIHLPSYVDYPLGHPEDRSGAKDIDALYHRGLIRTHYYLPAESVAGNNPYFLRPERQHEALP